MSELINITDFTDYINIDDDKIKLPYSKSFFFLPSQHV